MTDQKNRLHPNPRQFADLIRKGYQIVPDVFSSVDLQHFHSLLNKLIRVLRKKCVNMEIYNNVDWHRLSFPQTNASGLVHVPCVAFSQLMFALREHPNVLSLASQLWNTPARDLIFSLEGGWLTKPPILTADLLPESFVLTQNNDKHGLQGVRFWTPIQAMTKTDYVISFLEGGHNYHSAFFKTKGQHNKTKSLQKVTRHRQGTGTTTLTTTEMEWFLQQPDCQRIDVEVKAGDILLFDARLPFTVSYPSRHSRYFCHLDSAWKFAGIINYAPRAWAPSVVLEQRWKEIQHNNVNSCTTWPQEFNTLRHVSSKRYRHLEYSGYGYLSPQGKIMCRPNREEETIIKSP